MPSSSGVAPGPYLRARVPRASQRGQRTATTTTMSSGSEAPSMRQSRSTWTSAGGLTPPHGKHRTPPSSAAIWAV